MKKTKPGLPSPQSGPVTGSGSFPILGWISIAVAVPALVTIIFLASRDTVPAPGEGTGMAVEKSDRARELSTEGWIERARLVDRLFHQVYTPGWEGANGAIGDAFLFAATGDSTILDFHTRQHPLIRMFNGTWVDDRAWICLAELTWWDITGRNTIKWVTDAAQRYIEARDQGRLSHHEGYWSWYNWPPGLRINERIFTNSNMNQMVAVACRLYEATGHQRYLGDALLVWEGDSSFPGIERTLYKGDGVWEGNPGRAAFGNELPWKGTAYCSIGAAMYRATGNSKYRSIAVATAKHILDPASGWVDPQYFYQISMDGNGNFVQYLLDAYLIAPDELPDLPRKIGLMLDHVWTNNYGSATVTLHRESDHGIRNGWNPHGGEDGYGVGEIGTVHAQSQAVRAFGPYVYVLSRDIQGGGARSPKN
jgi:hypothetical protein